MRLRPISSSPAPPAGRLHRWRYATFTLVLLASTTTAIQPASAADSKAAAQDASAVVSNAAAPGVDRVQITDTSSTAFTATNANGVLSIPKTSSKPMQMSTIGIALPGTSRPGTLAGGEVVYSGIATDTNVVVRATDGGSQTLISLGSAKAPTDYKFAISLPKDGWMASNPDGSVSVWQNLATQEGSGKESTKATEVGFFEAPWARDAAGTNVKTSFEISGNTLIQHVDHLNTKVVYPVVADPSYHDYCGYVGCSRYISVSKTKSLYDTRFSSSWSGWGLVYTGVCAGALILTGPGGGIACTVASAVLINDLVVNLEYAGQNSRCLVVEYNRQIGLLSAYNWTNASTSNSRCHNSTY